MIEAGVGGTFGALDAGSVLRVLGDERQVSDHGISWQRPYPCLACIADRHEPTLPGDSVTFRGASELVDYRRSMRTIKPLPPILAKRVRCERR